MTYFVYKITNLVNGKLYIGKTKNVARRWSDHKSAAIRKSPNDLSYFHKAINKYGSENFKVEIIIECETEEQSFAEERNMISFYKTMNKNIGYNLTEGGEGQSGRVLSEETKLKISQFVKNNPPPHAFKLGNKNTKEQLRKISIGSRKLTDEQLMQVKELLSEGKLTQKEIGKIFGVDQAVISRIKNSKTYQL